MFAPRRPDKRKAAAELKQSLVLFGTLCVVARLTPYILHLYQKSSSD